MIDKIIRANLKEAKNGMVKRVNYILGSLRTLRFKVWQKEVGQKLHKEQLICSRKKQNL